MKIQKLPISVEKECDHPTDIINGVNNNTLGGDEIRMGRLGDALIQCGENKKIVVDTYNDLITVFE